MKNFTETKEYKLGTWYPMKSAPKGYDEKKSMCRTVDFGQR